MIKQIKGRVIDGHLETIPGRLLWFEKTKVIFAFPFIGCK